MWNEKTKKVYTTLKEIAQNTDLCLSINLNKETVGEINNSSVLELQNSQNVSDINVKFNLATLKQVLRLLGNIIYIRFNAEIKSLHFI